METLREYAKRKREEMIQHQKKLDVLEKSGLEIFVDVVCPSFEIRNYSLADEVFLLSFSENGVDYDRIAFMHEVQKKPDRVSLHCRHENWDSDPRRNAQEVYYPDVMRHNISSLIDFYRRQGVKPVLLDELQKKIERLYETLPTKETKIGIFEC